MTKLILALLLCYVWSCARAFTHGHCKQSPSLVTTARSFTGLYSSDRKGDKFDDDRMNKRSSTARQRQKEDVCSGQFASGAELKSLRNDIDNLKENLQWAEAMGENERILDLTKAIRNGERRDPDAAYSRSLLLIAETKSDLDLTDQDKEIIVERLQSRAQAARSVLPRFQLEGLWAGKFGDHGLELINVTYVGDTLFATKVTGDENVPRGQISFTANLSPANSSALEPLRLSLDQTSQKATKLARYSGKGQVAKNGFVDAKYVDGQLVMFDSHFTFVWIPTRHHVLFRRPTPKQALSLLRDPIAKEDEVENMRSFIERCFDMDMTDSLARQQSSNIEAEPFRRISTQTELQSIEEEIEEKADNNRFSFWNLPFFDVGGSSSKRKGREDN